MTPVLEVKHLYLSLRSQVVLEDINLVLSAGDFLGLIGPNGAGKTALLRVILGLVKPDSGSVRIFGKSPLEARALVGYVPQFAQFDADFPISVFDVVLMGRLGKAPLCRWYGVEDKRAAYKVLELLRIADLSKSPIGEISGGELQRVLIARALVGDPHILFLDEPTASLDTVIGQSVYQLLSELSSKMTIVLVSHDIGVISAHVKTIACLNRKLHYHDTKEISSEVLEEVYKCPVDLLAHGHAHRVLGKHEN